MVIHGGATSAPVVSSTSISGTARSVMSVGARHYPTAVPGGHWPACRPTPSSTDQHRSRLIVVVVKGRGNTCTYPRHCIRRHLSRPLRVDGLDKSEESQIQR